jgi:hypothetical protein
MAAYCDKCNLFDIHADNCPKNVVSCPYLCGISVVLTRLEEHMAVCEGVQIDCPNGCGASVRKMDLDEHSATECWIPCKFAQYGCKFDGILPNMQKHMMTDSHLHLEMLLSTIETQRTEINNIKQLQQARPQVTHLLIPNSNFQYPEFHLRNYCSDFNRSVYCQNMKRAASLVTPKEIRVFAFILILQLILPKMLAVLLLAVLLPIFVAAVKGNDQSRILSIGALLFAGIFKFCLPWLLYFVLIVFCLTCNYHRCRNRLSQLVNRFC